MKNFINRALVAKKHLKLFFALFAMLALGAGTAWAEEATLSSISTKNVVNSKGGSVSTTFSGVTCTVTRNSSNQPGFYTSSGIVRYYGTDVMKLSVASGNVIKKIVFTMNSGNVGTADPTGLSSDSKTWTGSAESVSFTGSATVKISKIIVTYEASGSTTQKEKYTLTYQAGSVKGSLEVEEGANLLDALKDITPVACDPTSTEPIGWSESEITTKQANEPTLLTDADVMPSKEHSVYYVFAKKETTGGGAATDITIDLSKKDQITTNTTSSLVFTVGDVTFTNTKVSGSTNANNYCPGTTGKTYTSTRTYNGHQVTIASANTISKIVITAGTNAYATAIQSATWTNATASASNTTVTITPNAGVTSISFKPSATAGMTKVVVTTGGGTTTISDYTTSCSGTEEPVDSLTAK